MRLFLRRALRVILWAAVTYLALLVVAFVIDAYSEATTAPLRPRERSIPSEPRAGASAPVDDPPLPLAASAPAPSDLADRAIEFMKRQGGTGRLRHEERAFREYATLAEDVTVFSDIDAELLLALSFRESSWKPTVEGDAGEIGLTQLHYLNNRSVLCGFSVASVERSPSLQLYLGVRRFELALEACRGQMLPALLNYASGSCQGPADPVKKEKAVWSANRVLGWAAGMRRER